jgi:hypothetical protein
MLNHAMVRHQDHACCPHSRNALFALMTHMRRSRTQSPFVLHSNEINLPKVEYELSPTASIC